MNRIINCLLLTVALAVSAPLLGLWIMAARAQEAGPKRETPPVVGFAPDRTVETGQEAGSPTKTSDVFVGTPGEIMELRENPGTERRAGPAPGYIIRPYESRAQADADPENRMRKLLSDYSRIDDEKERARVLEELTKVVSEQFEFRQEMRERELKEVEEHVRKLRALQQRRTKEKDQIVRDRVRQLLRDVDGLGWGDDASTSSTSSENSQARRGGLPGYGDPEI
jgi:hypothetical protein